MDRTIRAVSGSALPAGPNLPGSPTPATTAPEDAGTLPEMPKISRSKGSGSALRKSTDVRSARKSGSSGSRGAFSRNTGITGIPRFTQALRKAPISSDCHGPIPSAPTNTAADFTARICSSSSGCQRSPGRSAHSSSHGLIPYFTRRAASAFTTGLSRLLWQRKTSNSCCLSCSICAFTRRSLKITRLCTNHAA